MNKTHAWEITVNKNKINRGEKTMITPKIEKAFNEQLNAELYSAYLYYSMAAYFESINLAGFANWMMTQFQEEQFHASKFYRYINERGGRVLLTAIESPPTEWDSPLAAFEATLAHEQKVTGLINGLADMAMEQKDHASMSFLQWFVDEQVEEESSVNTVLGQLKIIKGSPQALLMLDKELSQRIFTPPSAEGSA